MFYGIENAIYELGGLICREDPRKLKSLIYHNCIRRVLKQKLINGQPQDIAIDGSHSFDAPMLGPCSNPVVNRGEFTQSSMKELCRELAGFFIGFFVADFAPIILNQTIKVELA